MDMVDEMGNQFFWLFGWDGRKCMGMGVIRFIVGSGI